MCGVRPNIELCLDKAKAPANQKTVAPWKPLSARLRAKSHSDLFLIGNCALPREVIRKQQLAVLLPQAAIGPKALW